ncbi:tRNA (adenosine(37)-N6)-dimethylallyltransferase MiaA [Candidatus Nomurabacteria bacterium RIFCSPHIGHO2_02_FULL_37_13]|uniref:tRNA dimethylallyltransferase n=1 Tax=Candidatus Nomurabacteria bacterium RIFCSPHIGHO2_02_FULL_37_13 TaxID=1801750 RepID=A0A1F6W6V0_9BACT|nr:MAG: tRNA (adenosine(37)-N6)-dimethylallyltransferase MiaA [Candidatus Nomurabacteria bacterium RIFCSPHIGHO2_01_FULL_36_23]OGI77629.1 MAG: tRNA (adenosine(37)-N6)-dimethylallyltransferase MiaA [Candidatus Nomurabacteria bacterium RIFCSPHIGHO2_02_FULL_37_13]OGI88281.1 MAG: tRNA (adenosine(37)-N6)-dimethylallyltransferase MiaA [Candidatus Nomurabacteria bacterium RIFCSPLOWO2_01_FULL_37_25]
MKKVIVILGQTATRKSDLAVRIAKKFNGEIISADSRQVYRGLDIGTGKITKKEMRGILHHLLDVADPKKQFTVAEYQKKTIYAIAEIVKKGKTPILCGGTGFYIDAITKGITFPRVSPNIKLRKILEKQSIETLFNMLKKLDKKRAKNIDFKNKVRLIRAIEIAKALGKIPKKTEARLPFKFIKIGLYLPPDKLKKKIEKRLLIRKKMGMLGETRKLHKQGLSWKRMKELGLEYGFLALYLQKKINKQKMIEKLNNEIYKYAKRQMTWFKRDKEIKWFDLKDYKKIIQYIKEKF